MTLKGNTLLIDWNTPLQVPPFGSFKNSHFLPAYEVALALHSKEIEAIAQEEAEPTFENTILAYEKSGDILARVSKIFATMYAASSDKELDEISATTSPIISQHWDKILMHDSLFARVKVVYESKDKLTSPQARRLTEKIYNEFTRGGALLSVAAKAELGVVHERLAVLNDRFARNVIGDMDGFQLLVTNDNELSDMPADVLASAKEAAKEAGYEQGWLFTTQRSSITPFLTYVKNPVLRKKIYHAYLQVGNRGNEFDNKSTVLEMVQLRLRKANLLGYSNYASYELENESAKNPDEAYKLLSKLWVMALQRAKEELEQMQNIADREGFGQRIQAHDWWYFAEKLRKEQYDLTEEETRPYFSLEATREGAFYVAKKLFGISFIERKDLPLYAPDMQAFEVRQEDGSLLGLYYVDYFVRPSKRSGAWMDEIRTQEGLGSKKVLPIIINVLNLNRPASGESVLLTWEEAETLFHEFGHALHGLLSDVEYRRLAGVAVAKDFVEFPSQMLEYWLSDKQVLRHFAKHYKTGESIPDVLIEKIGKAKKFNQGFANVEYLAASFLDLAWHGLTEMHVKSVTHFEDVLAHKIGLIEEIYPRYRSTYFQHIFPWGYSAGYYSYLWSNVLAADTFEYFKANGGLSRKIGDRYRKMILGQGSSHDPGELYRNFRGQEPDVAALISHLF